MHLIIDHAGLIDDENVRTFLLAIDAYQLFQLDIKICFFFYFTNGSILNLFSSVYVPAKKTPHSFPWVNITLPKQKFTFVANYDYRYQFRIKKKDEAAHGTGRAHG